VKRRAFVAEHAGVLAEVIAGPLALSADAARALVERGAVYVKGRRAADPLAQVPAGTPLMVVLEEAGVAVLEPLAPPPPLMVLLENDDLIAVDKPPGVLAQPSEGRVGHSLVDLVSAHLGFPAGLVHRLDRETSGVTVFGKNEKTTTRLAKAFREGKAKKRYLAATLPGVPEQALVTLPLSRDPSRPGRWRASSQANGIEATTQLVRLAVTERFALVALFPQTGRTHQLRAHLTALGSPILGDGLYAGAAPAWLSERLSPTPPRCLLHAQALHVDGRLFEASVPGDLGALFSDAGLQPPQGPW
jgi:23S rRNA pseudouridine1911/1915/1917 synthase